MVYDVDSVSSLPFLFCDTTAVHLLGFLSFREDDAIIIAQYTEKPDKNSHKFEI